MLNFTVGPVMSSEAVCAIGGEQVPYFRTSEFSELMLENERLMIRFAKAREKARAVFLTGSGTASMEAVVSNVFTKRDKVLVVDGGGFGHRFVELLDIYGISHTVIIPDSEEGITEKVLRQYDNQGFTGFLVNLDETSIGLLYDIQVISEFCKRNDVFLVVDSISSFLCDPFDMNELGVQVMITGSQKALACPPGISIVVLDERAIERVYSNKPKSMYLDLKLALKNGERGQTPFTPAVGILRQINQRLREINAAGGVDSEIERISGLAKYFRKRIKESELPFSLPAYTLPNAVTPVMTEKHISAFDIFITLKDEYGIWVCPNGGNLKDDLFRVGHIGNLTLNDYDVLFGAFIDMQSRGLI